MQAKDHEKTIELPKAFICHSSQDSLFAVEVAKHLERNLRGVFYYEEYQRSNESFVTTISQALEECRVVVVFIGSSQPSKYQLDEVSTAYKLHQKNERQIFSVLLPGHDEIPPSLNLLGVYPCIKANALTSSEAYRVAKIIVHDFLKFPWRSDDGLPLNPHLFDYEKDIIQYFIDKLQLEKDIAATQAVLGGLESGTPEYDQQWKIYESLQKKYEFIRKKQLDGCPAEWPTVIRRATLSVNELDPREAGTPRPDGAQVVAAALSHYKEGFSTTEHELCFPEAGPRDKLAYPKPGQNLNVAVVVSGGIAPGINAVIDGITQRHYRYAQVHKYRVNVYGIRDGFQAFDYLSHSLCQLVPQSDFHNSIPSSPFVETSSHVSEGGSILGTSRFTELLDIQTRKRDLENIVHQLLDNRIDILYVIGGDGSMKAAHAIWSFAQEYAAQRNSDRELSVIAVPKTMDNDILWVWQTFGFLSAVERSREFIENLATEVRSNPRLGVVQLFGSDSGFVVSHAVLASSTGICDAALIPEINFSMKHLASYLKNRMCERHLQEQRGRIPYGFIVLAETAIPIDSIDYVDCPEIGLSEQEKQAVQQFNWKRDQHERIEGQTDDALRTAGLKIVSRGLLQLLPKINVPHNVQPDWGQLRVFTNEPRHLLRATPAGCMDIITAQRLGILAVDNALAGYTDFMVSQWLTEYVLVPLPLVILGRKRIPQEGIFWKSVLAKTGQPFDLA